MPVLNLLCLRFVFWINKNKNNLKVGLISWTYKRKRLKFVSPPFFAIGS